MIEQREKPLISVVIACYNYAHYLPTAIASVFAQQWDPLEIIVVDDASTDATPEVMAAYADDERVHYIRNAENCKTGRTNNTGIAAARGDYILILAADDVLFPGCFDRLFALTTRFPDADIVYGGFSYIDPDGAVLPQRLLQSPFLRGPGRAELGHLCSEQYGILLSSAWVRRSVFTNHGGFALDVTANDLDLAIRWACAGYRFAYDPTPCSALRLHGAQQSGRHYVASGKSLREMLLIMQRHLSEHDWPQLRGYEYRIMRHAEWLLAYTEEEHGAPYADLRDEVARWCATVQRHADQQRWHASNATVAYIVDARHDLAGVEVTLRSLLAQHDADWRAYVLVPYGIDRNVCDDIAHLDARLHPMLAPSDQSTTMLYRDILGSRQEEYLAVLRSRTVVHAYHSAAARMILAQGPYDVAVFPIAVVGPQATRVFQPLSHICERAFAGPSVFLESLVLRRGVYDRVDIPSKTVVGWHDWDIALRLGSDTRVALNDEIQIGIDDRDTRGCVGWFTEIDIATMRAIYDAMRNVNVSVSAEREQRIARLEELIAMRAACVDARIPQEGSAIAYALAAVYGGYTELAPELTP